MKSNYKKLGRYIRQIDERNRDLSITNLQGVSITKEFVPSIANIIGTDLSTYKIVRTGQFAYGPVTSRNGDKVSIAILKGDDCIISSSYVPFEVYRPEELLPEYLMLWFMRPEFDRYARFMSNGSAREVFDWDNMCSVELPVPPIEEQRKIVHDYQVITDRIELLKKLNENVKSQMNEIYRDWFVNYSHFSDVGMQDSKIGIIPKGWSVKRLTELMTYAGGQQPPASEFIFEPHEGYVRLVQIRDYETDNYATYIPVAEKNKLCDEEDIMIARYGVSLGRICFGLNGAYNVALAKVFPNKPYYREYLRCFLNTDVFYNGINGSGERSAQQGFNQSGMDAFLMATPPDDVFCEFDSIVRPMFEYQLVLQKTIKKLSDFKMAFLSLMSTICSGKGA